MKKICFIVFLIVVPLLFLNAQVPSQAEMDKLIKQSQELLKQYGGDTMVNKALKTAQEQQKQIAGAIKNSPNKPAVSSSYSDPGAYGNINNWKFPPKNTKLLASLPKKVFNRTELVAFLNDLYTQLSRILPAAIASSVQGMTAKDNNDAVKMGDAAVIGWYTDHREEALLLLVKAAAADPDDGLLLNNCAAVLNMSGGEQKAIPILKYVLQTFPDNSMVLNNLGQAYAGLGETDTAMIYFGRCLRIEPEHPEACGTAGYIEESRGHIEKAVEYFEKAIKHGYSKDVQLKLRKLKKGGIRHLVRPRVKLPVYFNLFKYDLPAQCISTNDAVRADAEHNAFRKMITQQAQQYGSLYGELAQKQMHKSMQIMNAGGVGRKLRKDEFMAQPFFELSTIMAGEVLSEYSKELSDFHSKTVKAFDADMDALEKEYQQKYQSMMGAFAARCPSGEGASHANCATDEEICKAKDALADTYLPKFAYLAQEMQEKGKRIYRTYFDELAYWHYLSLNPLGADNFKMQYYYFIQQYLVMIGGICQTRIIKPCEFKKATTSKESNAIKEFDCPIDVALALGIAKVELNCEKFSITGGEGLIFEYEKNLKTKKSTLSVGIGVKFDLGIKAGPARAIVGVKATESVFISFDGNNGISDVGLENEVKATGHITGVIKESVSIGSKLGIQSGWDFNPGPLKNVF